MKWLKLSFKCQVGVELWEDSFLKTLSSRTTPLITRDRAGIPKGREFNWSEEKTWKLHEDLSPEGSREDRGNTRRKNINKRSETSEIEVENESEQQTSTWLRSLNPAPSSLVHTCERTRINTKPGEKLLLMLHARQEPTNLKERPPASMVRLSF